MRSQKPITHPLDRVELDEEASDPRLVRQDRPREPAAVGTPHQAQPHVLHCADGISHGWHARQAQKAPVNKRLGGWLLAQALLPVLVVHIVADADELLIRHGARSA